MSDEIRAAVIGCGPSTPGRGRSHSFGYAHARAYRAADGVRLTAAASRTRKNIDDFCRVFPGVKGYQDYSRMLSCERPELVSICVHPHQRGTMLAEALEAGARGVWMEKPFAETLHEARTAMEAAVGCGARLFINTQRRYGQPFVWLREAVEGTIGRLHTLEVNQPGADPWDTHLLDAAMFAAGRRRALRVLAAGADSPALTAATVHLSDGARLLYEAGRVDPAGPRPVLRANGGDGFAELYRDVPPGCRSIFRARFSGEPDVFNPSSVENYHHSDDPMLYMKRAASDILNALQTGEATRIDAPGAFHVLEIMIAVMESARSGRIVELAI